MAKKSLPILGTLVVCGDAIDHSDRYLCPILFHTSHTYAKSNLLSPRLLRLQHLELSRIRSLWLFSLFFSFVEIAPEIWSFFLQSSP